MPAVLQPGSQQWTTLACEIACKLLQTLPYALTSGKVCSSSMMFLFMTFECCKHCHPSFVLETILGLPGKNIKG